jgi:hypothetical protein
MRPAPRPLCIRTSVGHSGKFGHEFLEFELRPDGKLRYANNSQYKSDRIIRKEMYVGDAIVQEFKRIVLASEIIKCVVAGLIFKRARARVSLQDCATVIGIHIIFVGFFLPVGAEWPERTMRCGPRPTSSGGKRLRLWPAASTFLLWYVYRSAFV